MRCNGIFVFKSVTKRDGGSFTNDKGEEIHYDDSYVLKVDEVSDEIRERKFKFPCTNKKLYEDLCKLDSYSKICIDFEVVIYNNSCKLLPFSLIQK